MLDNIAGVLAHLRSSNGVEPGASMEHSARQWKAISAFRARHGTGAFTGGT